MTRTMKKNFKTKETHGIRNIKEVFGILIKKA